MILMAYFGWNFYAFIETFVFRNHVGDGYEGSVKVLASSFWIAKHSPIRSILGT